MQHKSQGQRSSTEPVSSYREQLEQALTSKRKLEDRQQSDQGIHGLGIDMSNWGKKKKAKFLKLSANQQVNVVAQQELLVFNKNNDPAGALEWFRNKQKQGISFKAALISSLLKIFEVSSPLLTNIYMYPAGGKEYVPVIEELIDLMEETKQLLESSYTLYVRAYAEMGMPEKSESALARMRKAGFEARLRTFSPLLASYCNPANDLESVMRVYNDMITTLGKATNPEITAVEFTMALKAACAFRSNTNDPKELEKIKSFFRNVLADSANAIAIPDGDYQDTLSNWYRGEENWNVQDRVTVNENGICDNCGMHLHSLELSPEQVKEFMAKIESLVRENTRGKDDDGSRWEKYKTWLRRREQKRGDKGGYDCVIDAANIAYYKQNYKGGRFRFSMIQGIIDFLERRNIRWLLIIHGSHLSNRDCRTPQDRSLKDKWMKSGNMYVAPGGFNDDWFWLYATLRRGGHTFLVSNDVMRDHHFNMLSQETFQRWRDRHQVGFDIYWDKKKETCSDAIVYPHSKFSSRTQLEYLAPTDKTFNSERVVEGDYDRQKEITAVHSPICTTGIVTSYQRGKQLSYNAEQPKIQDLHWLCCRKVE